MFVKLAVLACSLALAAAAWNGPLAGGVPAHQFPAGVSPQACPNYPNCNNPAVAVQPNAAAQGGWNGGWNAGGHNGGGWNGGNNGAWNGGNDGAWNGGHNGGWNGGNDGAWNGNEGGYQPNNALDSGDYTGDGDYRGEGLSESGAYGGDGGHDNGGWNNNGGWNGGWNNAAPAYNPGAAAQVPAGVDGHSCPNYPFCH